MTSLSSWIATPTKTLLPNDAIPLFYSNRHSDRLSICNGFENTFADGYKIVGPMNWF
jgi:hypothetical protein